MRGRGTRTRAKDRTTRAVHTQLQAMACEKYEIGILDSLRGVMMERTWTAAELEQNLLWLKYENAQNNDIFIRPHGSVGLIVVDDLTAAALERMRNDGLAPAVIVETSPHNNQALVRISSEPIPPELATAVARILAERYDGDMNAADWRRFSRLAGFTNRKPKRRQANGMQPFVLCGEATGAMAERGSELLEEARTRLHTAARPRETPVPAESGTRTSAPPGAPGEAYRHYAARYGTGDQSLVDWSVCKAIACAMLVDQSYLEQALLEGSPDLATRKAGHVEDYVARTARKVLQDSEVIAARERLAQRVTAQQSSGLIS